MEHAMMIVDSDKECRFWPKKLNADIYSLDHLNSPKVKYVSVKQVWLELHGPQMDGQPARMSPFLV